MDWLHDEILFIQIRQQFQNQPTQRNVKYNIQGLASLSLNI